MCIEITFWEPMKIPFFVFVALCAFAILLESTSICQAKKAPAPTSYAEPTHILVYDLPNHVDGQAMIKELTLHGVYSEMIPLNDNQLRDFITNESAVLSSSGVLKGNALSLPFAKVASDYVTMDQLRDMLSDLPVIKQRQYEKRYIILYGPQNCEKTALRAAWLNAMHVPYEYRDVALLNKSLNS